MSPPLPLNATARRYELTPPPEESNPTYLRTSVASSPLPLMSLSISLNTCGHLEGHVTATKEMFAKLEKKFDFHITQVDFRRWTKCLIAWKADNIMLFLLDLTNLFDQ